MLTQTQYRKGDVIMKEGSIGSSAYLIRSGRVEISKQHEGSKIVLAILEQGEVFGEMSLIDEKPRSATATALDMCVLDEITHDSIAEAWDHTPPLVRSFLSTLVERIRGVDEHILASGASSAQARIRQVVLSGMSTKATDQLGGQPLGITRFPFHVGRSTDRSWFSFSKNDLLLNDSPPYNVSRNHFSLTCCNQDIFVVDRGSTLGTVVNGNRIGGHSPIRNILCDQEENVIVIGSPESPFQFQLTIERENG
ncbi:MAG: cyclic nucleotide-binding domain-containing protein [Candidatus Tectomicrobia bacterium]|nr:cyclic nucleotide-binding domain-containing protein [Candidatus Tectomicrobia bacterium]